jgi:hypothetical protein
LDSAQERQRGSRKKLKKDWIKDDDLVKSQQNDGFDWRGERSSPLQCKARRWTFYETIKDNK